MAHVHDGSSVVFAKTNMQRPHDFSTGFCKETKHAWHVACTVP